MPGMNGVNISYLSSVQQVSFFNIIETARNMIFIYMLKRHSAKKPPETSIDRRVSIDFLLPPGL